MDFKVNTFNTIEETHIFLAAPGKRVKGILNGISPESVDITLNLQSTHSLTFEVRRWIDGEESAFYNEVDRLMELYVTHVGWFKIMEYPSVSYTANNEEYKTVTAESLEIELTGVDLVGFSVNTSTPSSLEILAKDNTYETEYGFTMFRDRVIFYRDVSEFDEVLSSGTEVTTSTLPTLLSNFPSIFISSWRIGVNEGKVREEFNNAISFYSSQGKNVTALKNIYNESAKWKKEEWNSCLKSSVVKNYPAILKYLSYSINYKYVDKSNDEGVETILSLRQVIEIERDRLKGLSLLDMVLKETQGWKVGKVDKSIYSEYTTSLSDSVGRFEVQSQNVYSFLTQDLSQYFQCIFQFDTDKCEVNAYRINSVGDDTNVILGWRNVQNQVTTSSTYDLVTKYYVYGTDYDIAYVNFGSNYIEDISYFLNEKYMPQTLITKYKRWQEFRNEKRNDYVELTRMYNATIKDRDEIKYRVPDVGLDHVQFEDMGDEQLLQAVEDYRALLQGYEALYVNKNGEFDIEELKKVPTDYEYYQLIKSVIIPNIETEIHNRGVASKDELELWETKGRNYSYEVESLDDVQLLRRQYGVDYSYTEKNGKYVVSVGFFVLYGTQFGIEELEIQRENFKEDANVLFKAGYSTPPKANSDGVVDDYAQKNYELYCGYVDTVKEIEVCLGLRKGEYRNKNDELVKIGDTRRKLVNDVDKNNQSGENFFPFTDKELEVLSKFYLISDYTNENIIITSLDDAESVIDVAEELYKDAVEQLYVESHPQISFSSTVDNLLRIPEYSEYMRELNLGDFIRVEYEPGVFTTLRLISLSYKPMVDGDVELGFSDMVKYKSKRNDFISILKDGNIASKNTSSIISSNSNSSSTSVLEINADVVRQLLMNSAFRRGVGGIANSGSFGSGLGGAIGVGGNGSGSGTIIADDILADYIKVNELDAAIARIETLEADSAFIKYLDAELINADRIVTSLLEADEANINSLSAKLITSDEVIASILSANEANINTLSAKLITADRMNTALLEADEGYIESIAGLISRYVQVSAQNVTGVDAQFAKVVAQYLTVGDLKAGTITLGSGMAIQDENGGFVVDSTGLSISGVDENGNKYCGVQLGYDGDGNPSLILRNSSGAILLSPEGLTEDAVVDGLIVNRMIGEEAVTGDKIDWGSCGATKDDNGNVTWNASRVVYNNEELSTVFTRIETVNKENSDSINSMSEEVAGLKDTFQKKVVWRMEILSSNGMILDRTNPTTTVYVNLYKDNINVTSTYQDCLYWRKESSDEMNDEIWNNNHTAPTHYIQLTRGDIKRSAQFTCDFILNEEVVVTQSI